MDAEWEIIQSCSWKLSIFVSLSDSPPKDWQTHFTRGLISALSANMHAHVNTLRAGKSEYSMWSLNGCLNGSTSMSRSQYTVCTADSQKIYLRNIDCSCRRAVIYIWEFALLESPWTRSMMWEIIARTQIVVCGFAHLNNKISLVTHKLRIVRNISESVADPLIPLKTRAKHVTRNGKNVYLFGFQGHSKIVQWRILVAEPTHQYRSWKTSYKSLNWCVYSPKYVEVWQKLILPVQFQALEDCQVWFYTQR